MAPAFHLQALARDTLPGELAKFGPPKPPRGNPGLRSLHLSRQLDSEGQIDKASSLAALGHGLSQKPAKVAVAGSSSVS